MDGLYDAVKKGDSVLLKQLIDKVESSEWENIQRDKLLFEAVSGGHHDCVEVLLKFCSFEDIVASGTYCSEALGPHTLLDTALFNADWKMVELLVDRYPETSTAGETGFSLHKACEGGDLKIIEVLLKRFPHHVHEMDYHGYFPIHCAAVRGDSGKINALIKAGADIHVTDRIGHFPIHLAAANGDSDTIDALLKAGADVNVKEKCDGETAFHIVCRDGHLDNVKLILDMTSDINVQDKCGLTPLSHAASSGHLDIVTLLLAKGADPTISSTRIYVPKNPLAAAARGGALEIVKALADLTPNEGRREATREAIRGNQVDCLNYLINEGFSPPLSEDLLGDAFSKVSFQDDMSATVEMLLENGVPISGWNVTPRILCRLNYNTLKVLLDFGWLESFWMKSNKGFLAEVFFKAGEFLFAIIQDNMELESEDGESVDEHDGADGESVDTDINNILSNFLLLQNYYPYIKFFEYNPRSPEDILLMDYLQPVVPKLYEICRWGIRCRIISKYGIVSRDHVQTLPLPKPLKVLVMPDQGF